MGSAYIRVTLNMQFWFYSFTGCVVFAVDKNKIHCLPDFWKIITLKINVTVKINFRMLKEKKDNEWFTYCYCYNNNFSVNNLINILINKFQNTKWLNVCYEKFTCHEILCI